MWQREKTFACLECGNGDHKSHHLWDFPVVTEGTAILALTKRCKLTNPTGFFPTDTTTQQGGRRGRPVGCRSGYLAPFRFPLSPLFLVCTARRRTAASAAWRSYLQRTSSRGGTSGREKVKTAGSCDAGQFWLFWPKRMDCIR